MMHSDDTSPGQYVNLSDEEPPAQAPSATVVTKAVALGYDAQEDAVPRVLATGKGAVAEQILSLAFAHGVRVRKDEDLIEVLSKLEVDSVIPVEAFAAVAEILSYVYRYNSLYGKPKADGTHPA